jgi:hypothetical protein
MLALLNASLSELLMNRARITCIRRTISFQLSYHKVWKKSFHWQFDTPCSC